MAEPKPKEPEKKPEDPSKKKDKEKAESMLVDAKETAERIEKANAETKELLDRQERLMTEQALSGKTDAGVPSEKPKTEDEKWAEDAKKRYDGTGMDPTE